MPLTPRTTAGPLSKVVSERRRLTSNESLWADSPTDCL
jgi:hypothetical protein